MEKHVRFTVLSALIAFMAGLLALTPLGIVSVNARGLGHEHIAPWRQRTSALALALTLTARSWMSRLSAAFAPLRRQPQLLQSAAMVALILVVFGLKGLMAAPLVFGATLTEGTHAGEFLMGEIEGIGAPSRENITVLSGQNLTAGYVIGRVNKGVGRISVPTVVGTGNGTVTAVYAGPEVLEGNYVVTCTAAATNGGTFSVTNPAGKALPAATVGTAYTSREINFTLNDGGTDFIVGDAFTFVVSTTAPTVIGTGNGTVSAITLGPDAQPGLYRVECITAITNGGTFKVVSPDGDTVAVGSIVAGAGGTLVLSLQRQLNITITDAATDFAVGDYFNVCVFNKLSGGKVVAWDPAPSSFDGREDVAGILYDAVNASSADTTGVIVARGAAVMKSALQWGAAITSAQKESAYAEMAKQLGIIAR